jgi:methylated-DNA-[protein]-cysteine S-methyltransferase
MNVLASTRLQTALGEVWLAADNEHLRLVTLPGTAPPDARPSESHPVLERAADELGRYFAGERVTFTVPAEAAEGTPFQRQVWAALRTIPYGARWSYRQLAEAVGRPGAARAVGSANARNPLPVVVPCHRVLGADGSLVGFAGGLEVKRALLALEGLPLLFPG